MAASRGASYVPVLAEVDQRLAGGRADQARLPCHGLGAGVRVHLQGARLHRDQRQLVTQGVVHLGGDAFSLVGLTGAAGKRVGGYSLGMRQRLGLAVALLAEPAALVLDEPANGLDPEGVRWLRGLLDDFATAGGTVLLSSHPLSEVQQIADRIVVLDRGRKVAEGNTADLLAPDSDTTIVDAVERPRLLDQLRAAGMGATPHGQAGFCVAAAPERIGALAVEQGIVLTRLEPERRNLEQLFFSLTHAA